MEDRYWVRDPVADTAHEEHYDYSWNRGWNDHDAERRDQVSRRRPDRDYDITGEWAPYPPPRPAAPQPRQAPDDSGYLTDPRYRARHPDDGRPLPVPVRHRSAEVAHRRPGGVHPSRQPPNRGRIRAARDDRGPEHGFLGAVFATLAFYVVPVVLYVAWALFLGMTPESNCLDPAGNPCGAPRTEALGRLIGALPALGIATALSLAMAVTVRWANTAWRPVTLGFAAAVVGGGIATVLSSVI